jgi:hypothetical protein
MDVGRYEGGKEEIQQNTQTSGQTVTSQTTQSPFNQVSVADLTTAYTGTVSNNPLVAKEAAKTTSALANAGIIKGNTVTTYRLNTKEGTLTQTSKLTIPTPPGSGPNPIPPTALGTRLNNLLNEDK